MYCGVLYRGPEIVSGANHSAYTSVKNILQLAYKYKGDCSFILIHDELRNEVEFRTCIANRWKSYKTTINEKLNLFNLEGRDLSEFIQKYYHGEFPL